MASLNMQIIVGHLGANPDYKELASGKVVANFDVATTESWQDKTSGDWLERTEWHKVEAWEKQAETCKKHLKKGTPVLIIGRKRTDKWEDEDNVQQKMVKIIADQVILPTQ